MQTMSEEERKKQQLIMDNKKAFLIKAKADKEYKQMLQENSMKDRKEKAKEVNPTSVGNKLNFGANMVKFEPPTEKSGGWGWARIELQTTYKHIQFSHPFRLKISIGLTRFLNYSQVSKFKGCDTCWLNIVKWANGLKLVKYLF